MYLSRSALGYTYTLSRILDIGDEVLNGETNKELTYLASWVQEVSSMMLIQFYQLLHPSTILFQVFKCYMNVNVNLYFL